MASSYMPLYAALATGLLGFIGSWMGAQFALLNFKRQRAFEKQLDWYERAIAALHDFAEAIEIASTFQQEPCTSREDLSNFWTNVQSAHLEIDRVSQEAPLYGSSAAVEQISKISKSVQKVADLSEAFDPPRIQKRTRMRSFFESTPCRKS